MLEFQGGFFLFPICYVDVLFMLSISGLLSLSFKFYCCKFPCSDPAGSRFFLLVCEIFGLALIWSCGRDGGDVFSG